jgi:hypothetical protein
MITETGRFVLHAIPADQRQRAAASDLRRDASPRARSCSPAATCWVSPLTRCGRCVATRSAWCSRSR